MPLPKNIEWTAEMSKKHLRCKAPIHTCVFLHTYIYLTIFRYIHIYTQKTYIIYIYMYIYIHICIYMWIVGAWVCTAESCVFNIVGIHTKFYQIISNHIKPNSHIHTKSIHYIYMCVPGLAHGRVVYLIVGIHTKFYQIISNHIKPYSHIHTKNIHCIYINIYIYMWIVGAWICTPESCVFNSWDPYQVLSNHFKSHQTKFTYTHKKHTLHIYIYIYICGCLG